MGGDIGQFRLTARHFSVDTAVCCQQCCEHSHIKISPLYYYYHYYYYHHHHHHLITPAVPKHIQ